MKRLAAALLFVAFFHSAFASALSSAFTCAGKWRYLADEDKMEGSKMEFATLTSNNVLTLGFPYQKNDNRGRLTFRSAKRDGLKLFIQIDAGQFMCSTGCSLRIKFDDAKPLTWSASSPKDGTSTVVFLSNSRAFFQKMKKSKRLLIEPNLYHESGQVLEFDPQGLTLN